MKRAALAALVLLLVSATSATQNPDHPTRRQVYVRGLVNGTRLTHSRPALRPDPELRACAQRHARRMAEAGSVWHSRGCGVARGEIVGMGSWPGSVLVGFWNSDGHRELLMRSTYSWVGTGVVRRGNTFYVVVQFR